MLVASAPAGSDPWPHDLDPRAQANTVGNTGSILPQGSYPVTNTPLKGRNCTCNLGMNHLPTIDFQWRAVSFREGKP